MLLVQVNIPFIHLNLQFIQLEKYKKKVLINSRGRETIILFM